MPRKTKSTRMGRPPRESWPVCKVEDCGTTTKGGCQGMCRKHYQQTRRGMRAVSGELLRQPKRVLSYGEGARCIVEGCGSRPSARGLCSKHFQQWQSGWDVGVEVPARGYGEKQTPSYGNTLCIVEGCTKRPVNKWMCSTHAQQREAGVLDGQGRKQRELKAWCRTHKPGPIKDVAGYLHVVAPKGYQGKMVDGRVLEHRFVLEQRLGRLLERHELVHHINGVKTDNRVENLQLRTQKTHPPAHEVPVAHTREALQHLKHNDPEAFKALLEEMTDECSNRPHQKDSFG